MKSSQIVNITLNVQGNNFSLEGIPEDAWQAFQEMSKKHFPEQEDAWASMLSEFIIASISRKSYVLTDVPEANSKALEEVLDRVKWNWEQFHTYLLYAAMDPEGMRIISFYEEDKPPQLGTFIVTGLDKRAFLSAEKASGRSFEDIMALVFQAMMKGEVQFTPYEVSTSG